MKMLRSPFLIVLSTASMIVSFGCSEEKATEPKIAGPEDPKLKRAGRESGPTPGGAAQPAGGVAPKGSITRD